eukprot:evm.model.NODE_23451_length_8767_cov_19.713015.1
MDEADAAHLRSLAALASAVFSPPEPHDRQKKNRAHLCRLVRSEDPLISHVATGILLKALRDAKP